MDNIEDRLAALEREVSLQRDQIEVRQLIASYGPQVDTADRIDRARLLADLWVEDGVYDIGGIGARHGREDIAKAFGDRHFRQVPEGVCHVMGLPFVRIAGDRATAFNYSCVMRPDRKERFFPWRVSANRWDLTRSDGGWRIERRVNRLMTGDAETLSMLREAGALFGERDR